MRLPRNPLRMLAMMPGQALEASTLPRAVQALSVALMVGLACWLGIELSRGAGRIASIWLANGLLVGVLLCLPTLRWKELLVSGLLGNVLANLLCGDAALIGVSLALCNTLEVIVVAAGMRRSLGDRIDLHTGPALRAFLAYAILLGPLLSALLAAALLSVLQATPAVNVIRVWYPADALGIGIVTPLVLAVAQSTRPRTRTNLRDALLAPLMLGTVTLGVFAQNVAPLTFLILPPLIFMVFRHGPLGAAGGIALIALISIPLTLGGWGVFSLLPGSSPHERVVLLQFFIAVCSAMALGVAMMLEQRQRFEQRVQQAERRLRAITDNVPALIGYVDRNQRYQFANPHYKTVFDVDPATFVGRTVRENLGDTAYQSLAEPIAAALRGDKVRFEHHSSARDHDLHLLVDYVPDRDALGEVCGFFISAIDITARKNAELRQAASEARLRTITDGLPGLIAYLDRSTCVRFCNATYEQWFGVPPAEMIGRTLDEVLSTTLLQSQGECVQRALGGERNETEFEIEFEGQRRSLQASYLPHRDASGKVLGVYTLASDITPLKRVQKQLTQLARYDALTGLANRGEFDDRLRAAMNRSERSGNALALMFMDVDHFKSINDCHGHGAGDEVLQELAIRLQDSVRKSDTVARLSGDEFVVILEDLHSPYEPHFVARKILSAIGRPIIHHALELMIGVSIGIAFYTDRSITPTELLACADRALYEAKAAGRNTYRIHNDAFLPPVDAYVG